MYNPYDENDWAEDMMKDEYVVRLKEENAELRALCDELAICIDYANDVAKYNDFSRVVEILEETLAKYDKWRQDNEQD